MVFLYEIGTEDGTVRAVSMLDSEWVFANGLCAEAILGFVDGDAETPTPATFRENPAFVRYLSRVVYERIGEVEGVRVQAATQGDGFVYLIDARTPHPDGRVPNEDIIGCVGVAGGLVAAGSWQHNRRHKLLTANGFFRLPEELASALDRGLRARCSQNDT